MRRKKYWLILAIISVLLNGLVYSPTVAYARASQAVDIETQLTNKVNSQLDNIDFQKLEEYVSSLNNTEKNILGSEDFVTKIKELITGESAVKYDNFFQAIIDILISTIKQYAPIFVLILSVALISSMLSKVRSKEYEKSINSVTTFVCMAVIIVVLATAIKSLSGSTADAILKMKAQMDAAFPILLTLTAALGGTASVGVYQPAVAILSSGITQIFTSFVLPLFILHFVFSIVGNLSNSVKLDKFNAFFFSLFKWTVGVIFTVFFAFLSIQGISAGAFDSVSIRTAKFTLRSYVPILGGYLSEGFDLILSSSVLIKNAIGVAGILLLFSSVLMPIMQIIIFSLMLKLISAILQPIADSKICNFLDSTSKSLNILLTCLIGVSFMYLILVGLVMCTGNIIV